MRHGTFGVPTVPVGVGNVVTLPVVPEPDPLPDPDPDPVPDPDPEPDEPVSLPVEPDPAPDEPTDPLARAPDEGSAPGLPFDVAVTAPAVSPEEAAPTGV